MKVSELIEWLKTQDQDAIVSVVRHITGDNIHEQGGTVSECEFNPSLTELTDFTGNQFVKPADEYYNKKYLLLGEING